MKPLNPWLVFRSVSAACLAAVLLVVVYWVYVLKTPMAAGIIASLQIVLPPAILFFLGLWIEKRARLTNRIASRLGYELIGVVAYIFSALAAALGRSVLDHLGAAATVVLVIGGLLPGLLLVSWWGIRKIVGQRAPGQN